MKPDSVHLSYSPSNYEERMWSGRHPMVAVGIRPRRNCTSNSCEHLVVGDHDKFTIFIQLLFSRVR